MSKTEDTQYVNTAPPLEVLNGWYEFADESARKEHWQYFIIDQFLRGNQNIRGNPGDNSLIVTNKADNISFPINKLYSTFRSVRAFVTRHKPQVFVEPQNQSPEAIANARRDNQILERDNQLNDFRKINKEWVYYGVKYGVGYRQIGYSAEKKCCLRWSVDPNDLLIGSKTGEMEDAPFVVKTVVHTVAYWRNKYPETGKDVAPDNLLAADEYKRLSLEMKYQNQGVYDGVRVEEQTAVGKELWYRTYKKNSLGGTINKVCFVSNAVLGFEETPLDEFPFIPYKSDIVPNEASGEGHLKHVIAPQRMLNLLNVHMLEYNHIVNRGRFLLDKNSGFRVINSKEGQLIFRNPGKSVQVLNPPSINPMLQWQLNFADAAIEDLGGQHDASMGATPARVSSGDAITALQQGDSNNISDLRDNFEDALAQEATWILKMYSLYEKEGIPMTQKVGEETESYVAVGEQAYAKTGTQIPERMWLQDNGDYSDVYAILPDHQVKVSVRSMLGETTKQKQDFLLQLVDRGLPLQSVLSALEFPNTDDILQRIAQQEASQVIQDNLRNPGVDIAGNAVVPQGEGVPPAPPSSASNAPVEQGGNQGQAQYLAQLMQLRSKVGALANG